MIVVNYLNFSKKLSKKQQRLDIFSWEFWEDLKILIFFDFLTEKPSNFQN